MKTPRVTDFDSNTKPPELKSSLDNMPAIQKPYSTPLQEKLAGEKHITQPKQSIQPSPERPNAPTPVCPNIKRIITRNSFETYEDQMESLRKLSYEEKLEGKLGSMSKMVREALDEYIQKRNSGK